MWSVARPARGLQVAASEHRATEVHNAVRGLLRWPIVRKEDQLMLRLRRGFELTEREASEVDDAALLLLLTDLPQRVTSCELLGLPELQLDCSLPKLRSLMLIECPMAVPSRAHVGLLQLIGGHGVVEVRCLGPCHVCEDECEYMGGAPHVGGVTEYCFECGLPTCAVHLSTSDEGNGDECHDCGARICVSCAFDPATPKFLTDLSVFGQRFEYKCMQCRPSFMTGSSMLGQASSMYE